jgi:DNA replication protein DnaC
MLPEALSADTRLPPELAPLLRRLKLSPVLATLPERVLLARQRKLDPAEWLLLVLGDEVQRRDALSARLRAHKAGLLPDARLERWDPTAKVTFDRAVLDELATLRFVDTHRHALLLGPVGVGKTFLAHALGHVACRRGLQVLAVQADKMLRSLRAARLDQTHAQQMRRLCTVDLLVVDDFALGPLDQTASDDFHEIVSERVGHASMIVTSNRDPQEWLPLMADPLRAQAAVDRLVNAAYDLVIEGESYRRRQKPSVTGENALKSNDKVLSR